MADESGIKSWIINPFSTRTVHIDSNCREQNHLFLSRPLLAPLLFPNESSDARDHCANERTFLSWLRLSIYMAVVSVAIIISFHLKSQPTSIERRIALPFGLIFWLLSLACLASGLANYVKTVTKYSTRQALVQTGWKTQVVSSHSSCLHVTIKAELILLILGLHHRSYCYSRRVCPVPRYKCCICEETLRGLETNILWTSAKLCKIGASGSLCNFNWERKAFQSTRTDLRTSSCGVSSLRIFY